MSHGGGKEDRTLEGPFRSKKGILLLVDRGRRNSICLFFVSISSFVLYSTISYVKSGSRVT